MTIPCSEGMMRDAGPRRDEQCVLVVGPEHTLRQTAQLMSAKRVGSAIVPTPMAPASGSSPSGTCSTRSAPASTRTSAQLRTITWDVVYAGPSWTLEEAAAAMVRGGFRHLVVIDGDDVLGIISVRDIMRVWTNSRETAAAT